MDPSMVPDASTAAEVAATSADPSSAPDASSSAAAAEDLAGAVAGMTLDERFDLLMSIGEECIQTDELRLLLQNKEKAFPICYDGFEPSGRMHIAQVQPSPGICMSKLFQIVRP
jgi:tyrosyl-tRNA synthetase